MISMEKIHKKELVDEKGYKKKRHGDKIPGPNFWCWY
jgi:hypothetical protein